MPRTLSLLSRLCGRGAVMTLCLRALAATTIPTVDITGGAPELNPHVRWLVEEVTALGRHVIDRCNLTVLMTAGQADLPEFFARQRVEVVASLPHYRPTHTDTQRGEGVFEKSIQAAPWLGWDGRLYDCDFNQMLELEVGSGPRHIRDFDLDRLARRSILVGPHCFGCTAGAGSSCGGSIR